MINQDRLIDRFLEYIQIDSESKNERAFADRLIADLKQIGAEVTEDNVGEKIGSNANNIIAKLEGTTDETYMFSSHMDTVVPGVGIKPTIEDGIIKSDGATILGGDDKAGVAAIVEMLTVLKEEDIPHNNIEVVFTVCEEVGLLGSKYLDYDLLDADYGFVLDSGGKPGFVVLQAPAQNVMEFTFNGKSAHAGIEPEKGISAIMVAAEAINNMNLLRIDEETTANVGIIEGGEATNIVTDKVYVKAEARSLDADKIKKQTDHMVEEVEKACEKYDIEPEINVIESYKPFNISEEDMPVPIVKEAIENIGLDYNPGSTGGGSDTNNYNLNGIPSVNLGVGMMGAHTLEEHIAVEDITSCAKLVLEIAKV